MITIHYHRLYKYCLDEMYSCQTRVVGCYAQIPPGAPEAPWIELSPTGVIRIRDGYSWDGPSGPARDTKNFMRASLVHDALYQLIEERQLSKKNRKNADKTMRDLCKEDGMGAPRRFWTYWGVRLFGGTHV